MSSTLGKMKMVSSGNFKSFGNNSLPKASKEEWKKKKINQSKPKTFQFSAIAPWIVCRFS